MPWRGDVVSRDYREYRKVVVLSEDGRSRQNAYVCSDCSSLVSNTPRHDDFHRLLDSVFDAVTGPI